MSDADTSLIANAAPLQTEQLQLQSGFVLDIFCGFNLAGIKFELLDFGLILFH